MLEYLFDRDWNQRSDIEQLKSSSLEHQRRMVREKGKVSREIAELREQVFKLELIQVSLLRYLKTTPGWNEETFRNMVIEIDLQDGKLDQKLGKPKNVNRNNQNWKD